MQISTWTWYRSASRCQIGRRSRIVLAGAEVLLNAGEVLVGLDSGGGGQVLGGDGGAEDVDAVEGRLGVDVRLVTPPGEDSSPMSRMKCLATFRLLTTFPARIPIVAGSASRPASTMEAILVSSVSAAASSRSRWAARSASRAGLWQAISRSPG